MYVDCVEEIDPGSPDYVTTRLETAVPNRRAVSSIAGRKRAGGSVIIYNAIKSMLVEQDRKVLLKLLEVSFLDKILSRAKRPKGNVLDIWKK